MEKNIDQYLPLYLGQNAKVIQYDLFEYKNELSLGDTLPISLESLSQIQKGNLKLIPILRPLSSMTEEEAIEIGWGSALAFNAWIKAINQSNNQAVFSIYQFKKLLEWGFDIFGLKEKGLALYPEDL